MPSSMPKYVLYYVLDKGQYFDLESVYTHSCFPNKETDSCWRVFFFFFYSNNLYSKACPALGFENENIVLLKWPHSFEKLIFDLIKLCLRYIIHELWLIFIFYMLFPL